MTSPASDDSIEAPRPVPGVNAPAAPVWTFELVYEELFPFVWRSVRRLGVRDGSIDDVVQEVFVVVHRRLVDFEGRASIKTWLFAIVRHAVRDHRRTARRKPVHFGAREGDVEVDTVGDSSDRGPHESVVKAQAIRMLHAMLDELDDDKREVFVLAELEQMTVPEIAEAVGVNLNTAYARLRAARTEFDAAVERQRAREEWMARARPSAGARVVSIHDGARIGRSATHAGKVSS